jgi:hypothetical protein
MRLKTLLFFFNGAGSWNRTNLYKFCRPIALHVTLPAFFAGVVGFEPTTIGFGDRYSDQTELHPY